METTAEPKKNSAPPNRLFIAIVVLIVVFIGAAAAVVIALKGQNNPGDTGLTIDYASDATVMLDQQSIQAAMDAAMENAKHGNIGLSYRNDAYSENGTDFDCHIANSVANIYDMFLTIFSDAEMTDQIYLSGLVKPGSGFKHITLDHALEPGDHRVYVVLTQVTNNDDGEQVICHQVAHTMDFHVTQ